MRLVMDTNVLVAAMRSRRGASNRLVLAVLDGNVRFVASTALFLEYEAVMTRAEHLAASGSTAADIARVLDDLARYAIVAERDFLWRPQLVDPDDEMVLETAINGGAAGIVTFETGTFGAVAARFGIEVLTPAAACARFVP